MATKEFWSTHPLELAPKVYHRRVNNDILCSIRPKEKEMWSKEKLFALQNNQKKYRSDQDVPRKLESI